MTLQNVILIEVGQTNWRRWMIFDQERRRYWSKGGWKKRRRNGELWNNRAEAEQQLHMVRSGT